MKRLIAAVVCTLLSLVLALGGTASAQDYPTRPVRVVIAFSPSGAIDILGRFIADKLSQM
jgi:tripartite-type tricarboxylate transporter receptor subunit TctC